MRLLYVVLWLALLANCAVAQDFSTDATFEIGNGVGTKPMLLRFGVRPEVSTKRFLATGLSWFSPNDKIDADSGYTFGSRGMAYARAARFFAGGGLSWSAVRTDLYSKGSLRPIVGGGWENDFLRIQSGWVFRGNDDRNGVRGSLTSLNIRIAPRFMITSEFGFYRAHVTDAPGIPRNHVFVTLGMAYTFWRRREPTYSAHTGGPVRSFRD